MVFLLPTKVLKTIKNILCFPFGKVKNDCIFAADFWGSIPKVTIKGILEDKVLYNEQENISAIKKKEKKQTRFQRAHGICKR